MNILGQNIKVRQMPRHSHFVYELYVRTMFTIFGCLLTLTMLAAFSHNNNHNHNILIPEHVAPCAAFGIIAAVVSAIVTNLLLMRHHDVGIILTCVIHIGVDSLTISLTLAAIPKITNYMDKSTAAATPMLS